MKPRKEKAFSLLLCTFFTSQSPVLHERAVLQALMRANDFIPPNRLFEGLKFKAIKIRNCTIITKIPAALLQANFTTREHQQTKFSRAFLYRNQTTNIK